MRDLNCYSGIRFIDIKNKEFFNSAILKIEYMLQHVWLYNKFISVFIQENFSFDSALSGKNIFDFPANFLPNPMGIYSSKIC